MLNKGLERHCNSQVIFFKLFLRRIVPSFPRTLKLKKIGNEERHTKKSALLKYFSPIARRFGSRRLEPPPTLPPPISEERGEVLTPSKAEARV